MFVENYLLNEEQKKQIGEMCAKIIRWSLEGRSRYYMAEQLKMHPQELAYNIDEMLYVLRNEVGIRRYLKILFMK